METSDRRVGEPAGKKLDRKLKKTPTRFMKSSLNIQCIKEHIVLIDGESEDFRERLHSIRKNGPRTVPVREISLDKEINLKKKNG